MSVSAVFGVCLSKSFSIYHCKQIYSDNPIRLFSFMR